MLATESSSFKSAFLDSGPFHVTEDLKQDFKSGTNPFRRYYLGLKFIVFGILIKASLVDDQYGISLGLAIMLYTSCPDLHQKKSRTLTLGY